MTRNAKAPQPSLPDPSEGFDARVDLVADHLRPYGLEARASDAIAAVRATLEALPGAGWIDVWWCGDLRPLPHQRMIEVLPRGWSVAMDTPPWTTLQAQAERAAADALRRLGASA